MRFFTVFALVLLGYQASGEDDSPQSQRIKYRDSSERIVVTPNEFEYQKTVRISRDGSPIIDPWNADKYKLSVTGKYSEKKFDQLVEKIKENGFVSVPKECGRAASGSYEGRFYPIRIIVNTVSLKHEVLYKSSPRAQPVLAFEKSRLAIRKAVVPKIKHVLSKKTIFEPKLPPELRDGQED